MLGWIILAHIVWFVSYFLVMRVGLYITDNIHKSSIKRWGTDIDDYEYNRLKYKIFVSLFFIGIPILFWIGFIQYYYTGAL